MTLNTLLTGLDPKLGLIVRASNPVNMIQAINRIKRELQLSQNFSPNQNRQPNFQQNSNYQQIRPSTSTNQPHTNFNSQRPSIIKPNPNFQQPPRAHHVNDFYQQNHFNEQYQENYYYDEPHVNYTDDTNYLDQNHQDDTAYFYGNDANQYFESQDFQMGCNQTDPPDQFTQLQTQIQSLNLNQDQNEQNFV
ncbi:hypothetical protein NQ315_009053 [Exocentrus adspersus]|uniref:Uncharacterized protein n=1 Tax=Exocentrus adspersus TaxID=1586481 RepID=A0AAV8VDR0_9CUCU|nr:hypothetical protein NQ315_009053 [Exocentrus adspersus]